ncbi:Uncharacterised protein [Mycobacteroides abscessus subsp. abscessus]|nr:Uncharacterised protein [Mycobacteroides abscessus subsp. abscessus]
MVGRVLAVAVGRHVSGRFEARLTARDVPQRGAREQPAEHLRHPVSGKLLGGQTPTGHRTQCDRRIEMPARNVTNRVSHCHHGQPERQCHSEKADAQLNGTRVSFSCIRDILRRKNRAATAAKNQPERAE